MKSIPFFIVSFFLVNGFGVLSQAQCDTIPSVLAYALAAHVPMALLTKIPPIFKLVLWKMAIALITP